MPWSYPRMMWFEFAGLIHIAWLSPPNRKGDAQVLPPSVECVMPTVST